MSQTLVDTRITIGLANVNYLTQYWSLQHPLLTIGPLAPNMCCIYSSLLITTYSGPAPFDLEEVTKRCYLFSRFLLVIIFCFKNCTDLLQEKEKNEREKLLTIRDLQHLFLNSERSEQLLKLSKFLTCFWRFHSELILLSTNRGGSNKRG